MPQDMNEYRRSRLYALRHTAAHLLARAVLEKFPDAKLAIGPPIEKGFYYDFELPRPVTPGDLKELEKSMKRFIKHPDPVTYRELDLDEARTLFEQQPFKQELLEEAATKNVDEWGNATSDRLPLSTYTMGDFEDLCRGPHVATTGEVNPAGLKLTHTSAAYWRGDESRPSLQRIYGTAWETKEALDHYLWQEEEAKKRDHRKLGQELDLFSFSHEIGSGLPLWLPKGMVIRDQLELLAKETEQAWGYDRVGTPHITKGELYEISGHLPYYADDMYPPFTIDEDDYYLKPMNCPHHHMVYKARPHSYRELPIRYAEYGTVYRQEQSGQLYGLMRVRGFSQNDAHIYTDLESAKDEFLSVMRLHDYYYRMLGIEDFYMVLALRDPASSKYHGDEIMWETAERITREAMEESGIPYVEDIGGAAHYGPKADFIIRSVTGREFAASTNQLDLYMPNRFGLSFVNSQGNEETPAVIHRAPLGSHERFVGFLIEHFAGAFPAWLAPVQVKVVPISNEQLDYAENVRKELARRGIRVEVDTSGNKMQKKVRNAEIEKVPVILVAGRRESEESSVAVRLRGAGSIGSFPLQQIADLVGQLKDTRALTLEPLTSLPLNSQPS